MLICLALQYLLFWRSINLQLFRHILGHIERYLYYVFVSGKIDHHIQMEMEYKMAHDGSGYETIGSTTALPQIPEDVLRDLCR